MICAGSTRADQLVKAALGFGIPTAKKLIKETKRATVAAYAANGDRTPDQDHDHPSRPGPARRRSTSLAGITRTSIPSKPSGANRITLWSWPRSPAWVTAVGSEALSGTGRATVSYRFVDSCRECNSVARAHRTVLASRATSPTTRSAKRGGYSEAIVVDENRACASDVSALDVAAPLLCAGITLLATAPLECRGEHAGGDHRPRRTGSRASSWPGADDGAVPIAEENGGRSALGGQELLRDRRTWTQFSKLRGGFDLDPEHRPANLTLGSYQPVDRRSHSWELGILSTPCRAGVRAGALMRRSLAGPNIMRDRRDPGDAQFLPSTATPEIERFEPTTSTTPTSACWPATCATGHRHRHLRAPVRPVRDHFRI